MYYNNYKSTIDKSDGFTRILNGNRSPKMTTHGWNLMVKWKYGSSDWFDLKDLKVSNQIELAEWNVVKKNNDEL